MKLRVILVTFVLASCSAWSCGSEGDNKNTNRTPAENRNTLSKASGNVSGNVNVPPPDNSNSALPPRNRLAKNMPEYHEPPPPLQFRPAPENSEIASTMNREGQVIETRVFKSHPQLKSVESTWLDATRRLLRIKLKSGKVVEVTTDKVASLQAAPSSLLVDLAKRAK